MKRIIMSSLIASSIFSVSATELESKISNFYVNQHGVVLFKLGVNAPEECINPIWPFSFRITDTAGKEWFEMLHQAKILDRTIKIGYSENSPSACTVSYIYYKD